MSPSVSLKKLYLGALRFAAAHNMPRLAALLMLPQLKTLKSASTADARTVLVLVKEGFTEDVMAALADADGLKVVALPRVIVKALAAPYLPYFIDDNNYISAGAEYDDAKLCYRRFWLALIETLSRVMRIDGMISGNYSYATERELASAMSERSLPFIALHKENLKTPGRVEFFERIYRERRGPFTGRKVLVYNQIERDLQIRAGVADASRIEIVGMPRLDRMHQWRLAHVGEKQSNRILFFVFSPATGMPRLTRKAETRGEVWFEDDDNSGGDISLAKLSATTCQTLLRVAKDNPDIEVVVKSKGRARDLHETAKLFGFDSEAQLPPNMRVVHGGDILDLIADASIVCGFNSTALLEAIAAGKPVVMPWFAEAEAPAVWPYLVDLRSVSVAPKSSDKLYDELIRLAREPERVPEMLEPENRKALALWTGNDDGVASTRTYEAIMREIKP
jgi:hypothetical protein